MNYTGIPINLELCISKNAALGITTKTDFMQKFPD